MAIIRVTSKDNPLLKTIRLVASQARRAPADVILVEGVRSLEEAVAAGCTVEAVLISDSFGSASRDARLLEHWESAGVNVCRGADALISQLSDVKTSQGALALVHAPELTMDGVRPAPNPLIICTCAVQDPGNLGTLIRTAAAAGATLLCTTPGTVSARSPKVIRASAGAWFRLPLVERVPQREFIAYCEKHGIGAYRTDSHEGMSCFEADLRPPLALVLGNEAQGLSKRDWEGIPSIHIPMARGVESMNVASAAAVLLFEAYRQRLTRSLPQGRGGI